MQTLKVAGREREKETEGRKRESDAQLDFTPKVLSFLDEGLTNEGITTLPLYLGRRDK